MSWIVFRSLDIYDCGLPSVVVIHSLQFYCLSSYVYVLSVFILRVFNAVVFSSYNISLSVAANLMQVVVVVVRGSGMRRSLQLANRLV